MEWPSAAVLRSLLHLGGVGKLKDTCRTYMYIPEKCLCVFALPVLRA